MLQDNGDCWQHILLKVNQYSVVHYAQTQQSKGDLQAPRIPYLILAQHERKNIVAKSKTEIARN